MGIVNMKLYDVARCRLRLWAVRFPGKYITEEVKSICNGSCFITIIESGRAFVSDRDRDKFPN